MPSPSLFNLFVFLTVFTATASPSTVGVTYSATTISPEKISSAVQSLKIPSLRLTSPSPSLVRAFSYTNTSLLLSVPNALVPSLSTNRSNALLWLYRHVVPFHPRSRISTISVGNNLLSAAPDLAHHLLPAITNLHSSLLHLGITKISVSTTFSFINIINDLAFPPSSATFDHLDIVSPILSFLRDTNSSFLVNLYPYNVYRLHPEIPVGFALFQEGSRFNFRDDAVTGVRYWNLFDMMVDAVVSAMAVAGHENVPVVVAETGWPGSSLDPGEAGDATEAYAGAYLRGLVRHLRSGAGTPLRREGVAEAFVFELVDDGEEGSTGGDRDHHPQAVVQKRRRNWGILYPNMTEKYGGIDFSSGGARRVVIVPMCALLILSCVVAVAVAM